MEVALGTAPNMMKSMREWAAENGGLILGDLMGVARKAVTLEWGL